MLALAAWTLFVWGGRIRNVANDDQLSGWSLAWRFGLAAAFVVLALALLVAIVRHRAILAGRRRGGPLPPVPPEVNRVAISLALAGSAVWLVRGVDIAAGDHSIGFKVVHLVLAVTTIALSCLVVGQLRAAARTPRRGAPVVAPAGR
jgi:hypothetical protein